MSSGYNLSVDNKRWLEEHKYERLPERPTHCVCRKPIPDRSYLWKTLCNRCGRFLA